MLCSNYILIIIYLPHKMLNHTILYFNLRWPQHNLGCLKQLQPKKNFRTTFFEQIFSMHYNNNLQLETMPYIEVSINIYNQLLYTFTWTRLVRWFHIQDSPCYLHKHVGTYRRLLVYIYSVLRNYLSDKLEKWKMEIWLS